jgi:putative transposase
VKFALVAAEKASYPVQKICATLGVSRSGYYAWRDRPKSAHAKKDDQLRVQVLAAHEIGRCYYGSPRIHRELRDDGVLVSRKRIIRIMQEDGIVARIRRRYKCTTVSDHDQPIAPNLLKQKFEAEVPNQRWVGDTTELLVGENRSKLYLAVIVDLYSRFVVGWSLSARNDRHLVMRALDMALRRRCPDAGLIHHSDQGSPYASEDYRNLLIAHGITCSMSRRGNCYDNAAMESWFSTFKSELGERFDSDAIAQEQILDYIEAFYNTTRRHSALDYTSPAKYERQRATRDQLAA